MHECPLPQILCLLHMSTKVDVDHVLYDQITMHTAMPIVAVTNNLYLSQALMVMKHTPMSATRLMVLLMPRLAVTHVPHLIWCYGTPRNAQALPLYSHSTSFVQCEPPLRVIQNVVAWCIAKPRLQKPRNGPAATLFTGNITEACRVNA